MKLEDQKIQEILLGGDYVTQEDIAIAKKKSKAKKTGVVNYFLSEGIINQDILGQAIAEFYKVPYADLNSKTPSKEQVLKIPENTARKFNVVFFNDDGKNVTAATDEPDKKGLALALKALFANKKIKIAYGLEEDIEQLLVYYRKSLKTRFAQIIKDQKRVAPEIIEEILNDALIFKASDIHFEPQEKEVVVRFRVDGVMNEAGRIPKEYYENILNRIKVQAHIRTDEHFAAQDGAIRYAKKNGSILDLRISIVPALDGEKVVIRILSEYIRSFTLSDLGLSSSDQEIMEKAIKKPFGMILVTGPTGSGKTTTLYGFIKLLNNPKVNIATIEDPVEYKILGVNHIQVNKATDLTFAQGLKSIVRQDPDIILVGEIRDKETAEIAVNAALTGHLLFSTFHANDAATAIPRLLDMGIEKFLLASTVEVIIAQRLVRRICENCRASYSESLINLQKIFPQAKNFFSKKNTLYKGKGCSACNNTGYKGRIAIYEIIQITPEMKDLILKNPSTKEIWKIARVQGSKTLFEDGIDKAKNGITTLEELLRVASPL